MTRNIFIAYEDLHERRRIPEVALCHEKYDPDSTHQELRLFHVPMQLVRQYSDHDVKIIRLNDLPEGLDIETHIRKDPDLNPPKEGVPKKLIKNLIKAMGACFTAGIAFILKTVFED